MLSPGDTLSLAITDIAFGGEGVARSGEFVVFVPFVIAGEQVEAEIIEVKKSFARAKLLHILQASPERTQPGCPYYGECGGCQYQHIVYAEQLRIKEKQIRDLFQRVGHFQTTVEPIAGSPKQYGYRNRIMVRSQWNKPEQKLNIGFIRYDNRLVVDIDHCPISEPEVSEGIKAVRANPPPKGGLKVVLRKFPEDWEVPRDSFFQNNFFLLPELVKTVRGYISAGNPRFLIDLYCGVGFFGIELAPEVERVIGIELDKKAIGAARNNAGRRGVRNADFLMGDAQELLPAVLTRVSPGETTIIIDPPRTGCAPSILALLRETRPRQIIYVSCHPATLARDLNVLCADGVYDVKRVKPLDMFPQTQHVECVADISLKSL
jgi:tRNA/tmRNA/rRNA uracil-C5-methylase (TrmA/RlmC/RlmD family)